MHPGMVSSMTLRSKAFLAMTLLLLATACAGGPSRHVAGAPDFIAPVDGLKTSGFSAGGIGYRKHDGVDLSMPYGAPIRATASGEVIEARTYGAYGMIVRVDHGGGWHSMYAHLSRFHVKPGYRVRAGDIIGEIGTSGNATGPHLHFEILRGGEQMDPERFMAFQSR